MELKKVDDTCPEQTYDTLDLFVLLLKISIPH